MQLINKSKKISMKVLIIASFSSKESALSKNAPNHFLQSPLCSVTLGLMRARTIMSMNAIPHVANTSAPLIITEVDEYPTDSNRSFTGESLSLLSSTPSRKIQARYSFSMFTKERNDSMTNTWIVY